ncbi:hypothetical protein EC957_009542 [Mortierella hygrophila]|uniref:F-box domain-containing protein n=1 Tax=Mortierella hygrophila TaxID=979708 RepID=A0A9P6FBT1_9FUNG|nr:hypothetical protein EC957_009542 [Mortierella hygrophila]
MATTTAAPVFHLHQSPSSGINWLPSSHANDVECNSGSYRDPLVHPPQSSVQMPQSYNAPESRTSNQHAISPTSNIAATSSSSSSSLPSSSSSVTTTTVACSSTSITSTLTAIASHKEMPFYGLPPEILQHIASFLPFHGLVRLYTSLPKLHRPIFQLLLDHSLALMMLTLEIRQLSDEQPPIRDSFFVSMNNNTNGVGAAKKLQTHWRVTDFDLERMRVEFQLEEKLGLEMAGRRRWEVEYQIQQQLLQQGRRKEQLDSTQLGLLGQGQGEEEDIENLIWRTRTGGISNSSSTSSLIGILGTGAGGAESQQRYNTEVSDSNFFHCNGSSHTPTLGSATVSFKAQRNMPAPWISQHFDFADHSTLTSSLASVSASVSASASASSSTSSAPAETPAVIRARERVAAHQQNRLLLRALEKMRSCEESSKLQFLPVTVELETEELGQKKVEAELVDGTTAGVRRRTSSGYGKVSEVSASLGQGAKLGRRHSWQTLRPPADRVYGTGSGVGVSSAQHPHQHHHYSTLEPLLTFGNDLSSSGWTKALKRILKRSSWNGNSNARSRAHTAPPVSTTPVSSTGCSVCDAQHYQYYNHYNQQQQQQQPQRRSMDSLRTVDWSSVFHSVASSMNRSSSSASSHSTSGGACQCQNRKAVLLTTSKQQGPSAAAPVAAAAKATTSTTLITKRRSFSNMVAGYRKGKTSTSDSPTAASSTVDKGKGKGKSKSTVSGPTLSPSSSKQEQERQAEERHQKLFEFSYGVRHNYLHSHRLEGERVIRPMRFACSLDFFIQD